MLILRDDAYGMIKWKQAHMQLPSFGLDYGNPDFVKYVEAKRLRDLYAAQPAGLTSPLAPPPPPSLLSAGRVADARGQALNR